MNTREIFKKAWALRRIVAQELKVQVIAVSMSECLKLAYFQEKNSTITYREKNIANVYFTNVQACVVSIFNTKKEIIDISDYEYTDFQKIKIETVKKYITLVEKNNSKKLTRKECYEKLAQEKNVKIEISQFYSYESTNRVKIKFMSEKEIISYYDYKNWYRLTENKYKKNKNLMKIQKKLGSHVEMIENSYNSTTKKVDVVGVYEIENLEIDLNELIDYDNVVLDLLIHLSQVNRDVKKGYYYSIDFDYHRPTFFHLLFMLDIKLNEIQKFIEKMKEFRENKEFTKLDVMRKLYAIFIVHRNCEHYFE